MTAESVVGSSGSGVGDDRVEEVAPSVEVAEVKAGRMVGEPSGSMCKWSLIANKYLLFPSNPASAYS